ncbi:MAG: DUF4258 domain-containing protein [Deltaproteobacteria bacterium]|jgi:hypothetical protein|nr:DUF4258 domain-containing protein [Deltaproteobacteria bacterium]
MTRHLPALVISLHAAKRCEQRQITINSVIVAISRGVCIETNERRRVFARGRLRVVLGHDGKIVTAWREDKTYPKRWSRERRKLMKRMKRRWVE